MKRLLVLRHGRTEWNANGRFQGQLDPPLDALGRSQAETVARHLAHLKPAEILTSDLARAYETADALADLCGINAVREPRLREMHLGAWQGLTREEVIARFPDGFQRWVNGSLEARPAGENGVVGETYTDVGVRIRELAAEVTERLDDGDLAVFVTHGGTTRAFLGAMLGMPEDVWWRFAPLGNCCWSLLLESDNGWRLGEHGVGVQETAQPASAPDIEPGMSGF